jgi:hypothetical protein
VSGWTLAWIFWIGFFLVVEGWALASKKAGSTLSEHVWRFTRPYGNKQVSAAAITARTLVGLLLVWLLGHFILGWWTPTHPWPW